jgi:hypothetical protein
VSLSDVSLQRELPAILKQIEQIDENKMNKKVEEPKLIEPNVDIEETNETTIPTNDKPSTIDDKNEKQAANSIYPSESEYQKVVAQNKENAILIEHLLQENYRYEIVAKDLKEILENMMRERDQIEDEKNKKIEELIKEKDTLNEDLLGMESSYDVLQRRFDKLKSKTEEFIQNEEELRQSNDKLMKSLERDKLKYATLKKHAEEEIDHINNKLEELDRTTSNEISNLNLQITRLNIENESMKQKIQERVIIKTSIH